MAKVRSGSIGNEIEAGQLLPFRDREADIAYKEIIVRRSNRCAGPLPRAQAAVGRVPRPSR